MGCKGKLMELHAKAVFYLCAHESRSPKLLQKKINKYIYIYIYIYIYMIGGLDIII